MKLTHYTIIGKDINLLKGHVENVKHYAGFDELQCEKEFLVIVYTNPKIPRNVTSDILEYCWEEGLRTVVYDEPEENSFLENLYACFNLGYEEAKGEYVFRSGSDQAFCKGAFPAMMKHAEPGVILQANTVENHEKLQELKTHSRHFEVIVGNDFEELNLDKFENIQDQLKARTSSELLSIDEAINAWGKPAAFNSSLGVINRTDGCSWLMRRKDWEKFGPMPPIENGITGDVIIHDRMQKAGYRNFIVRDCLTVHFVQGEQSKK